MHFIGYPKETVGHTFYHRSEGKIFVAKNGSFLEEFLSKEVSGRKVELDEVNVPAPLLESSGCMYENKVWTLVDFPDDRQAIENKWIFKKKTDVDGNVTI